MSHRGTVAILLLLSALSIMSFGISISRQSSAATGGMSYHQLISDPNFVRAVKSIAEACNVNVDIAKLKC
jgi:hypothetical protein